MIAAVDMSRSGDSARAIVRLKSRPSDAKACPVGQTAHADFPDVDAIDLIRVWLRL